MTFPFIQLYLDEDVSAIVAKILRARGFPVTTTQDAVRLGATDEEQFTFAATTGLTVLTHNRVDFESIAARYAKEEKHRAGVIIAVRRPAHEVAGRVLAILGRETPDRLIDQVRYI